MSAGVDLPQEIGDYIKENIDYSLGLPVSTKTLELKLLVSEDARMHTHDRCLHLQSRLKEKDEIIERTRAESNMNAQALKVYVERNQKLDLECSNLFGQCQRWERECLLYDHDREAQMDFGNEADERAKEAEIRVLELEEESRWLSEELKFYKNQSETKLVDRSLEGQSTEKVLIQSFLETFFAKDEVVPNTLAFLEANRGIEVCQTMLKKWNNLTPTAQKILALIAEVKTLQKDREHLRINLQRAEDEVKVLFEDNNVLDEENRRLMKQYNKENYNTPGSAKSSKGKSGSNMSSLIDDFSDLDSLRQPLSPVEHYSPEFRTPNKQVNTEKKNRTLKY